MCTKRRKLLILGLIIFGLIGVVRYGVPELLRRGALAREGGASEAIGQLRTYDSAQRIYRASHGRYGTVDELVGAELLDGEWTSTFRAGRYDLECTCFDGSRFQARANPVPGFYKPYFFLDERGVIRYNTDRPATANDETLGST